MKVLKSFFAYVKNIARTDGVWVFTIQYDHNVPLSFSHSKNVPFKVYTKKRLYQDFKA